MHNCCGTQIYGSPWLPAAPGVSFDPFRFFASLLTRFSTDKKKRVWSRAHGKWVISHNYKNMHFVRMVGYQWVITNMHLETHFILFYFIKINAGIQYQIAYNVSHSVSSMMSIRYSIKKKKNDVHKIFY